MKTRQISVRLSLAFSLLIALLVAVGVLGLGQAARINREFEEINGGRWTKTELVRDALGYSDENNRITMEIFFLEDTAKIDPLLVERSRNTEKITAIVEKLESLSESDRERELLDAVQQARGPYIISYLRGVHLLVAEHRYADAQVNMMQDTLPRLIAYHDAWKTFEAFQRGEIARTIDANRRRYLTTRGVTVSLIVLTVALAVGIAALVVRGTTEQISSQSRIEQERLDAFLEHIPDWVYFKDRDSRFVRLSRSLATHFGLSDPELALGKTDFDYFSSEHAEQAFADEQEIIRSGQPITGLEEKETWPDGHETWALTTKVPLRDRQAQITGTMGISHNITDRKRAELELQEYKVHLEELVEFRTKELRQTNEQLQVDIRGRKRAEEELARQAEKLASSNAELEQFAYVASHDLQEPLRMVASYTQLLARRYKGKLSAEADEFIGFAVDGATRMQQLILDLLSYSRLTTKGNTLNFMQAEAACHAALENLHASIKESNAKVTVGTLPGVFADATQLTQLFQNLIGNAIKYRNERKPEISVTAEPSGTEWVFSVRDNGIGIEPQYSERIFQMFQRLHTRAEYSGTGIGLAVCRKIVERHGGKIRVESQLGKGSTFLFTIPRVERGRGNELTDH